MPGDVFGGAGGDDALGPDDVDEFVVVMADPVTGEVDAFGPYAPCVARAEVARRRTELVAEGLGEVLVLAVGLSRPA